METLDYRLNAATAVPPAPALVCGVVSSGNLEILIQPGADPDACLVRVQTSARGFGPVWQAVLDAFAARHAVGGLQLHIQDIGATPAVVSLRLDQALMDYLGSAA